MDLSKLLAEYGSEEGAAKRRFRRETWLYCFVFRIFFWGGGGVSSLFCWILK